MSLVFNGLFSFLKSENGMQVNERRFNIRFAADIYVQIHTASAVVEGKAINLSLAGLCVEVDSRIKAKSKVSLHSTKLGNPIDAIVIWCHYIKASKKYRVGLSYSSSGESFEKSWLKPALSRQGTAKGEGSSEQRKLLRVPCRYRLSVKGMSGVTYSVGELVNLSLGGCLVESEVELPLRLKVRVRTELISDQEGLRGVAEVRSCKKNSETGSYLSGLRFVDADEALIKRLMGIMMSKL